MPHVLVLCEYGSLNGGERSLLAVLGGLLSEGYRMIAAAPTDGPLAAEFAERGVPVVGLDLHDTQGRRFELRVCRFRSAMTAAGTLMMSRKWPRLGSPSCSATGPDSRLIDRLLA